MPSNQTYDEKDLLSQLSQGNEHAFRQVFDKYSPRINAFAIRLTRSPILAEEIVQEVFAGIWQRRKDLPNILNLEAWLITLAKNTGSSMLRRMAHERLIMEELRSGTSAHPEEDTTEWQQYHDRLRKAILALPPQQQKVWIMSRLQRMKQQQIADEMGISIYTVKEYLKISTKTIRKIVMKFIFCAIPSFLGFIRLL